MKTVVAAVLLAAGFHTAKGPPEAWGRDAEQAKVYYGNAVGAKKPAVVVASTVFDEIPEYKEIKQRRLTEADPEYYILLNKANAKFYAAVRKAAEEGNHDCVAEMGTVKFDSQPADLTRKSIDAIGK